MLWPGRLGVELALTFCNPVCAWLCRESSCLSLRRCSGKPRRQAHMIWLSCSTSRECCAAAHPVSMLLRLS